jgi:hypothetical protein
MKKTAQETSLRSVIKEIRDLAKQATEGDRSNQSTGRILYSTLDDLSNALPALAKKQPQSKRNDFCLAWKKLANEVIDEYIHERQMLENYLVIPENRPRWYFGSLPEPSKWRCLNDWTRLGIEKIFVREIGPPPTSSEASLSILLPIQEGYRRTFRSLACLCYDVIGSINCGKLAKNFDIKFHVFINFSDDNSLSEVFRFAHTLCCAHQFRLVVYYAENPKDTGRAGGRGRWWKTSALNVMLGQIRDSAENRDRAMQYIHIADDDIFIPPGSHLLAENIRKIQETNDLIAISAATCCDVDYGFSAVSSVRKRRKYVQVGSGTPAASNRLFNLYGSCLTTRLDRLETVLYKYARSMSFPDDLKHPLPEDVFLTIVANENKKKPEDWCAYADRLIVVEHPEPTNILARFRRLARDAQWQKAALKLADKSWKESFARLRKLSFRPIQIALESSAVARDVIAYKWNYLVLLQAEKHASDSLRNPPDSVDWSSHMTQHQICKQIVNIPRVFDEVSRTLMEAPCGFAVAQVLQDLPSDPSRCFPQLCRELYKVDPAALRPYLTKNPFLFHLYAIVEESLTNSYAFLQEGNAPGMEFQAGQLLKARREDLQRRFPVDWSEVLERALPDRFQGCRVSFRKVSTRSKWSHTAYISITSDKNPNPNEEQEFFLRFYNVVGRELFFQNSPRRTIYLHLLGDQVMKQILAFSKTKVDIKFPETLYPTLEQATIHYSGPEKHSPSDRLLQSILLQESLSGKAQLLKDANLSSDQLEKVISIIARFLGVIHGATWGWRPELEKALMGESINYKHVNQPAGRLVISHLNQIRLVYTHGYRSWLVDGMDPKFPIRQMLQRTRVGEGDIGAEVARKLQWDLSEVWEETCFQSEKAHREFGSVGSLGLYLDNLMISVKFQKDMHKVFVSNHSSIAMIDPALDAGLALVELTSLRLNASVAGRPLGGKAATIDDSTLPGIQTAFRSNYLDAISAETKESRIPEAALSDLEQRTSRLAAFFLLARYDGRYEYDLTQQERTELVRLCCDLFQVGTRFQLSSPDPSSIPARRKFCK